MQRPTEVEQGMAHLQAGRWSQAEASLRRTLALQPDFAEVWGNLGYALKELGRHDEARAALERALRLKPRMADAWNLLGLVEQAAGRQEAAHRSFTRAIELRADFAYAWMNRATSDFELGRRDEALAGFARALALDPSHPQTHFNLAHVHHVSGDAQLAIGHYREAVRLRPAYAEAHLGLAHVLRLSDQPGAMRHYEEAARLDPSSATCHRQLSNALFLEGRFDAAWQEYGWRRTRLDYLGALARAGLAYRLPRRDELRARRVAIVGEQGLGDNLFFLRYAPEMRSAGALLEYVGDRRLHGPLGRTGLFDSLVERAPTRDPPTDYAILSGDLAMLFPEHAVPQALPPALALSPLPARAQIARGRLRSLGPPPYVALTWRAGEPMPGQERLVKEIEPGRLGEALRDVGATWVAVQRGARADELAAIAAGIGRAVHDESAINDDLEDALAMMAVVDDYVGVSNTNVHLRAGVSTRAHVLVPFPPEWRWMAQGASPWFPAFAVYRQDGAGRWEGALRRLAADIGAAGRDGAPRP
jgi:tetratricopeptide (TPR) repeat protein